MKHVPGRKSDVSDCQWLQYLHAVGLLRASVRPEAAVCVVRALLRHRETLVAYASSMQEALDPMHPHLQRVISDHTGKTGLVILVPIPAEERDPALLAQLRDARIEASDQTFLARAGTGRESLVHVESVMGGLADGAR